MKITLSPTDKLLLINDMVEARLWNGVTDRGVEVYAVIVCVACSDDAENERLSTELQEILTKPIITGGE